MSRFTIIKGQPFTAKIQIKKPNASEPILLDANDTAYITISTIGVNTTPILSDIPLQNVDEEDRLEGKFTLYLTAEQTELLISKVGFIEDGGQPINSHKGTIIASTLELGPIAAYIPQIYVVNEG